MPLSFALVSLLSLLLFYFGTGRNKRLVLIFIGWQVVVGSLALAGIFSNKPFTFPVVLIGTVIFSLFYLQNIDKQQLNTKTLVSIHVLRIPVELLLYGLFLEKKVPQLMTFSGWNFDILIGISALLLLLYSYFTQKQITKRFLLIWNGIGIVFLLIIVSLAILSSPLPIQQLAFEQPNIAVLAFPYCFLPSCVVPLVLLSHILLIRQARRK